MTRSTSTSTSTSPARTAQAELAPPAEFPQDHGAAACTGGTSDCECDDCDCPICGPGCC